MGKILIVITTEPNEKIAKNIANLLIKNKLAACVSIKHIDSIYKWEDKIEQNKEFELTIKSKPEFKDNLILFLQKNLSYDVPQILHNNFNSECKYHEWLNNTI